MDSYVLIHRRTGTLLRGYQVAAADQQEIDDANQRLKAVASDFCYISSLHLGHTPITPEVDVIDPPCPSQPAP